MILMCLIQSLVPFRKFPIPFALRFKLKTSFCFWVICISFSCFPVALVSLFDMQGFHQKLIMFYSSCQQNQRGNSHQNCNYWTTHVLHQSQSPMGFGNWSKTLWLVEVCLSLDPQHIEAETKWPPDDIFKCISWVKCMNFDYHFTDVCS